MKINVEFDLTPDEFRQALGLPNVEAFQQSLLEQIQQQMESGVEGYDPMTLMRPFMQQPALQQGLSQGMTNFGTYQQMMMDMLKKAGASSYSSKTESSDNENPDAQSRQTSGHTSRDSSTDRSSSTESGGTESASGAHNAKANEKPKPAAASSRSKRNP
ncbi:hypothetical protein LG290_04970 [Halomonas sediminis]